MKKLFLATAAFAVIATPAFAADSDSKDFRIRANVKPECSIADPENVNFGNLSINRAPGTDALTLTTEYNNNFQNVWASCNYAAGITLTTLNGGLTTDEANDGPDAADFTDIIYYHASLRPSDGSAFSPVFLNTESTPGKTRTRTQTDAFHDEAILRIVIPAGVNTKRPLAGQYSDVATVSLGPV